MTSDDPTATQLTQQTQSLLQRRSFLAALVSAGTAVGLSGNADAANRITPRTDVFRVRVEIDIKGNVNLAKDPLVTDSVSQQLPVTGKTLLDYEERFLRPRGVRRDEEVIACERQYHEASAESTLSRNDRKIELSSSNEVVIARRDELPETIYSVADYLSHEELDLLRGPVSSVAVDRLIPTKIAGKAGLVRAGQKLPVDSRDLASALNLSAVADSDVQIELVSEDARQAKLQLRGKLDGSVQGVPTRLRLLGKLTFDRSSQTTTWAALAIHETREIGKAEPGFDITSTIRMIRKPLAKPQVLSSLPSSVNFDAPAPRERLLMNVASERVGVKALLDRRWRVMQDNVGEAILRMIDNEENIAQCNIRPLARLGEGEQWTLPAFEADVRRTLGDQLGELLQSDQEVTDSGLRMLKVAANGQVQGVPIQWVMMHFSDDHGRRIQVTMTMDGDSVAKLDGSDVQLAASLQLVGAMGGMAETEDSDQTAEKLSLNSPIEVESSQPDAGGVLSPSDLNSPAEQVAELPASGTAPSAKLR